MNLVSDLSDLSIVVLCLSKFILLFDKISLCVIVHILGGGGCMRLMALFVWLHLSTWAADLFISTFC